MGNRLKPYEEYKETGLPWLDRVPLHWDLEKIKHLFNERIMKGYSEEPLLAATQSRGVVLKNMYENRTVVAVKGLHLLKLVKIGDFVISLRSFQGGIEYAYCRGIISPAYTIITSNKKIKKGYFRHLGKSRIFLELLKLSVTGIREGQNIDYSLLKNSAIPLPPQEEQDQIVKYLDSKISKINKFIKAKKKQIELLKEQKQAIINQTVTKGLDPNVKMKPSGIEWLEDIPEGWDIIRNKNVLKIKKNTVGENSHNHVLLSLTIKGIVIRDIESGKGKFPTDFSTYQQVGIDDIVFCLFDIDETPRTVGLSCLNGMITGAYTVFEIENINKLFLYYYYLALDDKKALKPLYTGLRKVINTDVFLRSKMIFPPVKEQGRIVNYIETKIKSIDIVVERVKKEIDLITEYKTSLTSNVVTGKVDVRQIKVEDVIEGIEEGFEDLEG